MPEQLSQIKQTSLSRVICDNGDDIQSVPKNIFRMEDGGHNSFVECKNLPAMSFNVWFGELVHEI